MSFEPNVGQAGPEVAFLSRGRGYDLSVERAGAGARLALSRPDGEPTDVRFPS